MARAGLRRSLTIVGAVVWLCVAMPAVAAAGPIQPAGPIPPIGTIHTIELPGGVEGIRRAIGDRRPTSPASVVIEMARRFHGGTSDSAGDDPILARLRAWLRTCAGERGCDAAGLAPDRVPLPGAPAMWRDVVFQGRVPEAQLLLAILDRRDAALLYTALLSMREEVRAWILARPALVRQLCGPDAGPLLVAAPYLRIDGDRWQLPGGPAAAPIWLAVAGVTSDAPDPLLLALLRGDGLPAYMLEVVATLSDEQQRAALSLADADVSRRVGAGVELLDGLRVVARGWDFASAPSGGRRSIRPSSSVSCASAPTTGCCCRAAACSGRSSSATAASCRARPPHVSAWDDPTPVSAGWLVSRIWIAAPADQSTRYEQVLFASRWFAATDASQAAAVATILRGYARYPQLLRVLDRLGVDDVARLAALVHRADGLAQAAADWRGHAAMVRWQSALVFLDHMTRLGAVDRDELHLALDALAAPEPASASRGTRVRALVAGLGVVLDVGRSPAIRRRVPSRTRWWRG